MALALLSVSACVSNIPLLKDIPYIGTSPSKGQADDAEKSTSAKKTSVQSTAVDRALADLFRGDFVDAEARIADALVTNPDDPYAVLAAAILYQNTDRYTEARAMYERLLAMDPHLIATARAVVRDWSGMAPRPLSEVARVNLQKLDDEQMFGTWINRSAPGAAPPSATLQPQAPWASTAPSTAQAAQTNRIRRFTALARLRDDGLVSAEEYDSRRTANLGALLPLSTRRPAAGLDQSFPPDDKIIARLIELRKRFQTGLIGRDGFIENRARLLDALLPVVPAMIAPPASPPMGLLASADRIRALEEMKNAGLISGVEMIRERTAIEDHLRQ